MQDLFGDPIAELPIPRRRSSSRLGSPKHGAQQAPQPELPAISDGESLGEEPELQQILADLSMHDRVGRYLKDRGLPCVDVFEVRESRFANAEADLELFDFLVSAPEGHNWLLYAAPLSTAARDDLREWERVFGPTFQALTTEKIESDDDDSFTLSFRTLDGEQVSL